MRGEREGKRREREEWWRWKGGFLRDEEGNAGMGMEGFEMAVAMNIQQILLVSLSFRFLGWIYPSITCEISDARQARRDGRHASQRF